MIDKNGKTRLSNSRSIENLDLEAVSHDLTKTRLNVTVLPKTSKWLKGQGNASQTIDGLVAAAIAGKIQPADDDSQEIEELTRENSELKAQLSKLESQLQKESEDRRDYAKQTRENSDLKAQISQLEKETEEPPDYQVIRDKVLSSLKLGKQAPGYKTAVKAIDRFIAEMP